MESYKHHIFVCLGKRCAARGSEELLDDFKTGVKAAGLSGDVRVSRSGCVKVCKETATEGEFSPVVIVYPEGVWYRNVTAGDVEEIIERHIVGGEAVDRLVHFRLEES